MKQKNPILKAKKTVRICTPVTNVLEEIRVMEGHGDKPLFSYKANGKDNAMTYAEFVTLVKRTAKGITEAGLAGKHVALLSETRPEWFACYFAVLLTGGVVIPMDKELAASEIVNFLAIAKAEGLVFSSALSEKANIEEHPTLSTCIAMDASAEEKRTDTAVQLLPYCTVTDNDGTYEYPETVDNEKMCEMLFTSGTTGTSKCVMLSQKNVFSTVTAATQSVEFFPDDVILSVLPIHHTYELAVDLAAMNYGIHICINDSLRRVLPNIQKYKPTGLVLVPLFVETMYKKILAEAKKSGRENAIKVGVTLTRTAKAVGIDLRKKIFRQIHDTFGGRLKKIICGGAALNPKLIRAFDDFGISIYEGYGITECSPLIAVTPYFARKYGSVGPAVQSCEARIAGNTVGDKGYIEGEIEVKGDNVMLGYYGNAEANADAFTEDGWYRTGDVGYMDDDGYIYITGRIKSVIVLENGKNVFPEEIEEYLADIEEIAEAVVVGRKAENSDAIVLTALIFADASKIPAGSTMEEMQESIRKQISAINKKLPSFKQIHKVEFRDTEFEKTTTRKIRRNLVK
ncbi:MAG: AMP-binding protein [Clostridia bacterium]|nr:AMP-binding protein [Clostridia bacterium]